MLTFTDWLWTVLRVIVAGLVVAGAWWGWKAWRAKR